MGDEEEPLRDREFTAVRGDISVGEEEVVVEEDDILIEE